MSAPMRLEALLGCPTCGGRGEFKERHGPGLIETLVCECVFRHEEQWTAEQRNAVDAGEFEVISVRVEADEPDWSEDA